MDQDVLIIGAGASGVAAAITAAERGERVTLLERNRKALKKLGVAGNGRGNLLNAGAPAYFGDADFAAKVFENVGADAVRSFWARQGVTLCEEDEGRMYPAARLASVAVDALMQRLGELGVTLHTATRVTQIIPIKNGFEVQAMQAEFAPDQPRKSGKAKPGALLGEHAVTYHARRVIVAAGGSAAPAQGTDGSLYPLLGALGHTLVPPRPALCPLLTTPAPEAALAGLRVRAKLTLTADVDGGGNSSAQRNGAASGASFADRDGIANGASFADRDGMTSDTLSADRDGIANGASFADCDGMTSDTLSADSAGIANGASFADRDDLASGSALSNGNNAANADLSASPSPIVLARSEGEALFTADGISGIAAMQLARFLRTPAALHLDLRAAILGDPDADALAWLQTRLHQFPHRTAEAFFIGATVPALARAILNRAGIPANRPLTAADLPRLAQLITDLPFPVQATRGFDAAQVTAGGISTAEIDPRTMQSKLVPNLYLIGELLNIDGDCGGHNLAFAIATAIIAAQQKPPFHTR